MAPKRTRSGKKKARSAVPGPSEPPATTIIDQLQLVTSLAWFWGSNSFGQLGFGSDILERTTPTKLDLNTKVRQIAVGGMHTLLLLMDGTLWSFGVNDEGALGRETKWNEETEEPVEGFDSTKPERVYLPLSAATVIQIACSDSASFALTANGVIYGWGTFRNQSGVFGFTETQRIAHTPIIVYHPARQSPAVKISAGNNHVVAVLKNGTALSWGDGDQGQLGRLSLRNSERHSVKRKSMLSPSRIRRTGKAKVVNATCGEFTTFIKTEDGSFYSCGANHCGQLAIQPKTSSMSQGQPTKEDRISCGVLVMAPTLVTAFDGLAVDEVAVGRDHGLGRSSDGKLYSWGAATYGVLGRQSVAEKVTGSEFFPTPTAVDLPEDVKVSDIDCGQICSGCVSTEGDLYTWGAAMDEILGQGRDQDEDVPVPKKAKRNRTAQNTKFTHIYFGGQHAAALSDARNL